MNLTSLKKLFAASFLFLITFFLALFLWLPRHYAVPVIMYHSIAVASDEPLNNVRPQIFARQMAYLKRHGYKVLSLDEYANGIREGKLFPHNSVVITFDDGFEDNYTNAWPILKKYGFPATIFVPTDSVGRSGRLTWAEVKEMSLNGITMGSHLKSEVYLPSVPVEVQRQELWESKKVLEANLGRPVLYLAYPVGGFTDGVKGLVQDAGYKIAFTTNRGNDSSKKHDTYALKRIRLKDTDTSPDLWLKLSGYYNLLRQPKNAY
ncbi:MAG: polysaccharide deacetylase family protein [Candidatus Omnitrophica bacterium]|nr:polysaccharide deacetylase family protein [Candidatus Omnitrophota bacterium]